jgi:hypothetical protein
MFYLDDATVSIPFSGTRENFRQAAGGRLTGYSVAHLTTEQRAPVR